MENVQLDILNYSYWEHFKAEKDLALILPVEHKKRVKLRNHMDILLKQIHNITDK